MLMRETFEKTVYEISMKRYKSIGINGLVLSESFAQAEFYLNRRNMTGINYIPISAKPSGTCPVSTFPEISNLSKSTFRTASG